MKMKRISLLAAALLGATFMMAAPKATESTIKASDSRITYIGRTEVKGGDVSFDWTGTYLKVRFQGNALSFKVSDTKKNYYNVWLDGSMDQAPDKVVAVHGTDTTIVLFSAGGAQGPVRQGQEGGESPASGDSPEAHRRRAGHHDHQ